jgi:hypothetical protein
MQWDLDNYLLMLHNGTFFMEDYCPLLCVTALEQQIPAWDIVLFSYGRIGMKLKFRNTSNSNWVLNLTPIHKFNSTILLTLEHGINNATVAVGLDICSMYIETDQ